VRPSKFPSILATPAPASPRLLQAAGPLGVLMISLLTATGCSATGDVDTPSPSFRFQQSAADARTQLAQWAPIGASLADATRALSAQGFTCNPTEPSAQGLQSSTLCITATPVEPTPAQRITAPPTPVNWFVTLDSRDGSSVSAVQVARTPRDIAG